MIFTDGKWIPFEEWRIHLDVPLLDADEITDLDSVLSKWRDAQNARMEAEGVYQRARREVISYVSLLKGKVDTE